VGVGDEGPGISSEQSKDRNAGIEAGSWLISLERRDDEVGKKRSAGKRPRGPDLFTDERWWQPNQAERPEASCLRYRRSQLRPGDLASMVICGERCFELSRTDFDEGGLDGSESVRR
jgi:hypothetical protein